MPLLRSWLYRNSFVIYRFSTGWPHTTFRQMAPHAGKLAAIKARNAEQFAAAQKAIEESEKEIQAAVQPQPMHFEIEKENR